MRILLFGANGQVGHELRGPLASLGELTPITRSECDIADLTAIDSVVAAARPTLIVNAAAYNDVDGAEDAPALAERVNAEAVGRIGELAARYKSGVIHMSTDYVYDGNTRQPYREADAVNPLGAYARSKLRGEQLLFASHAPAIVLRTAWVYSLRRKCFLSSMLALARRQPVMHIVDDQFSSPTFSRDLAVAIALIVQSIREAPWAALNAVRGVYHAAGQGFASRYELVREAVAHYPGQLQVERIEPTQLHLFPAKARRPYFTPLDSRELKRRFGVQLPDWRDGVRRAMADFGEMGAAS